MKKLFYLLVISITFILVLPNCKDDQPEPEGTLLFRAYKNEKLQRELSYNTSGKLVKSQFYNTTTGEKSNYYTYEYNADGTLQYMRFFDNDGNQTGYYHYTYDTEKKPAGSEYYTKINGSIRLYLIRTYEYFNNDKTIRTYELDSLSQLIYYSEVVRDASSNNAELRYYGNDSLLKAKFFYTYDGAINPMYYTWKNMGIGLLYGKGSSLGLTSNLPADSGEVSFFVNPNIEISVTLYTSIHETYQNKMVKTETTNYLDGTNESWRYEYKQ